MLEKTKDDYNLIAEDFSRTRVFVSKKIKNWILQYIFPGERILDLGCGNGRFYEIFENMGVDYFGTDISDKLIALAKSKHPQANFQISSAFNLPFPDEFFDKVLSVAVFHHIPSEEFRIKFLKEVKRVLKPKGLLVLMVWNLNPFKMILIGKNKRVLNFLRCLILKILKKSELDFNDFFIPWSNKCQRYVHYFSRNELVKLIRKSGLKMKKSGFLETGKKKEANIYLIAQK